MTDVLEDGMPRPLPTGLSTHATLVLNVPAILLTLQANPRARTTEGRFTSKSMLPDPLAESTLTGLHNHHPP